MVTGTADDVEGARRLVADSESAISRNVGTSVTQLYKVKYASPDDLQNVLSRLVPSIITTPAPVMGIIPPAPTTADSGGATSTTTSYGAAASGTGGTTTAVTGNMTVKPTTTALLLTGSTDDIARALQVLATVDVRPMQINYEARVLETSVNNK